jgi:hypothetical protein
MWKKQACRLVTFRCIRLFASGRFIIFAVSCLQKSFIRQTKYKSSVYNGQAVKQKESQAGIQIDSSLQLKIKLS